MKLYLAYKKILVSVIFILALATAASADKWKTMTFGEDIAKSLQELGEYCLLHDITVEDVLWANKSSVEEIKSGQTIYLPANQIDMLSIWQNQGAWKPTALVPVTSAAAASRLQDKGALKNSVPPAQIQKPKSDTSQISPISTSTPPIKPILPEVQATKKNTAPPTELTSKPKAPADSVLAQDKSKSKADNTIPGLMDPIIIFSPNGDPATGPMRLIISGDKVEVVQLPKNAAPKRPSLADLDHTFGTYPSYLPSYDNKGNIVNNNKNGKNANYQGINLNTLNGKMLWPVDGTVSSPFGKRGSRRHDGIDIPMPLGTPIRAARNGVVAKTGTNTTPGFRGYGNFVLLDHGGGIKTLYAHCSTVGVVQGQRIMQGQIIANVGCTGRSTTNHVHFEVRVNDHAVNPIPYLANNPKLARSK